MSVEAVTDDNFEKDVVKNTTPTLVDFWAPWCGPCRMIAPVMEELSTEFSGKLKVVKMNIDENPITPSKFQIRSIPTILLFKDGKAVATQIGAVPKSKLVDWIKAAI